MRILGWALASYVTMVLATEWTGPQETWGLMMQAQGMSPRPTPAPGNPKGIPNELRRRQNSIPIEICGYIGSSIGNVLSCQTGTRCVYLGTAVGCCNDENLATCSDLYTTCVDTASDCDAACSADAKILKCPRVEQRQYCGQFAFSSDFTKYQCVSGTSVYTRVQLVAEYFATVASGDLLAGASGISFGSGSGGMFGQTTATASSTTARSRTSTSTGTSTTTNTNAAQNDNNNNNNNTDQVSVSTRTIGIISGVVAVVLLLIVVGCCIWCCRRRKAKKAKRPGKHNQAQEPLMYQPPPPPSSYGPSELHNISTPHSFSSPPGGATFPPPPQYTASAGGFYTDPKNSATEIDGHSTATTNTMHGGGHGGGNIAMDPHQRTDTVSPVSSTTSPMYGASYGPPPPPPPPQQQPPRPQGRYHHAQVYEMGSGGR